VLGKPPNDDTWSSTVRTWFCDYYAGRAHEAATCVIVVTADRRECRRIVRTRVTFDAQAVHRWLEWYLETCESRGKAGGYGIQGAGGVFVSQVEGSLSNVVGLPLGELLEMFRELDLRVFEQGQDL